MRIVMFKKKMKLEVLNYLKFLKEKDRKLLFKFIVFKI